MLSLNRTCILPFSCITIKSSFNTPLSATKLCAPQSVYYCAERPAFLSKRGYRSSSRPASSLPSKKGVSRAKRRWQKLDNKRSRKGVRELRRKFVSTARGTSKTKRSVTNVIRAQNWYNERLADGSLPKSPVVEFVRVKKPAFAIPARKKVSAQPDLFLTLGLILFGKKKAVRYYGKRNLGRNESEKYFDRNFSKDFVDVKKHRFHMIKYDYRTRLTTDQAPRRFFFYHLKKDPVFNSFLFEKIISSFTRHGKKEKIRKIFYRIFLTEKYGYSIQTLYWIIDTMRPSYINVPVRKGNRYYYAPIPASPLRSTLRAIRFFKMAVMAHKHEDSLEDKILLELEYIFEF